MEAPKITRSRRPVGRRLQFYLRALHYVKWPRQTNEDGRAFYMSADGWYGEMAKVVGVGHRTIRRIMETGDPEHHIVNPSVYNRICETIPPLYHEHASHVTPSMVNATLTEQQMIAMQMGRPVTDEGLAQVLQMLHKQARELQEIKALLGADA